MRRTRQMSLLLVFVVVILMMWDTDGFSITTQSPLPTHSPMPTPAPHSGGQQSPLPTPQSPLPTSLPQLPKFGEMVRPREVEPRKWRMGGEQEF